MKRIAISGGFDPIHPGHIAQIEDAAKYGEVHIILNSNEWLIRKKGFFFQSWHDRKKVLEAYTPHIHAVDDTDGSVREALQRIKPHIFGKGGAYEKDTLPEYALCEELGIEMVFDLGGSTYVSSTALNAKQRVQTRWGWYDVILDMPKLKVKMLHIEAGKTLSLQKHQLRSEFFFMPNGEVRVNLPGVWHVLAATKGVALDVLEVQVGDSAEEDIEKIHESHEAFAAEKDKRIHMNT